MLRTVFLLALWLLTTVPAVAVEPDLELIMSDPDWIGNPPTGAYWSDDGCLLPPEARGRDLQ